MIPKGVRGNKRSRSEVIAIEEKLRALIYSENPIYTDEQILAILKIPMRTYYRHNHTAAIDFFDRAILIDPNSLDAYVNKGTALGVLAKYSDSLRFVDKALVLDPNNTAALTVKALTLYSAGNSTQAKGFLDKVLDIEPNNMFVFSLRMRMDNATEG